MSRIACFESFYEKVSVTLIGDFSAIWFSISKNHWNPSNSKIIKFTYADNVQGGQNFLPVDFIEIVPCEYCKWKVPLTRSFHAFHWDMSLSLEFRAMNPLILRGLEFDILLYSNFAGPKYQGFE